MTSSKFNLIFLSFVRLLLYKLLKNNKCFVQAQISIFHTSDIWAHLFQKIMKNLFSLKSPKNTFGHWCSTVLLPLWSSKVPFCGSWHLFHFIMYCYKIFVRTTFLSWHVMQVKLFFVNGYHLYQAFTTNM